MFKEIDYMLSLYFVYAAENLDDQVSKLSFNGHRKSFI